MTTLRYRPPARLEHYPFYSSKYTSCGVSCGVLKSPGNGSEITGRGRNKKTLQASKKGLQRCFLASQKRFELPTPRLGVTIITYTPSIVVLHDSRSTPNYTVFRGAISSFNIVDTPLYLLVFRSAISKMLAVLQRSQNLNQLVRF